MPPNIHSRSRYTDSSSHALSRASLIKSVCCNLLWADSYMSRILSVCAGPNANLRLLYPLVFCLEISCHGVLWLIVPLLTFISCHRIQDQEIALNLFLMITMDLVIIFVLKSLVCRRRPESNEGELILTVAADQYSFPSGHTSRVAILFTIVKMHVKLGGVQWTVFCTWCALVVASRLVMGRHYPSDVFVGWIVGILEYLTYLHLMWLPTRDVYNLIDPFIGHVFL